MQLPVLVNRGWVPSSMRNEAMEAQDEQAAAHEQPVVKHVEETNIKEKNRQSSWWSRWAKPQVTEKVSSLF